MIKRRKQLERQSAGSWLDDREVMVFGGDHDLPLGAIEQHSISEWAGPLFGRAKSEVRADWEKAVAQISDLLKGVSAFTGDYDLEEMTFQLGFSAEGRIVFVAKSGVTATISVKFKKRGTGRVEEVGEKP